MTWLGKEGAVVRAAPYWLTTIPALTFAYGFGAQHRHGWELALLTSLGLLYLLTVVCSCWLNGRMTMMQQAIDAYEETVGMIETSTRLLAAAASDPIKLTGGGPMDGETLPDPAALWSAYPARVIIQDEDHEPIGAYVPAPDDVNLLVWEPWDDEDEDAP